MTLFVLVVVCGATFRITRLLTHDLIMERIRKWVDGHAGPVATYFVHCTWCVSVWVSLAVVLVVDRFATVPLPGAVALTASAFTGIVESHIPED